MLKPISSASMRSWKQKKEKEKKVSINWVNLILAWDMLQKKMQKLNLSEAEQDLIKQDILHKEAELNRKMYVYF